MNKINGFWSERIRVDEYFGYQVKNPSLELYTMNLHKYNRAKSLDLSDMETERTGYGFELIATGIRTRNRIKCELKTNNMRHAWLVHLDYVINVIHGELNCLNTLIMDTEQKLDEFEMAKNKLDNYKDSIIFKFKNDFADILLKTEVKEHNQFSSKFNFGEYLNYWELGYENSVTPNYLTLKQELLNNTIATITSEQYYQLYERCSKLLPKAYTIKAHDIGINNKKFDISKGEPLTINHLIALKLYTDYGKIQNKFKKHCRKYNANESLQDFILRNSEIAHWCRYLMESCTFYGTTMDETVVVYTGLKHKLLFESMNTHFYCPLSTTRDKEIAHQFSEGTGVMLMLKAANPKTRFLDVSWLSTYPNEHERLFIGSGLKICDIFIRGARESQVYYILAIQMFEQIITGQFVELVDTKIENELYYLMRFIMSFGNDLENTMIESIQQYIETADHEDVTNQDAKLLRNFLIVEEYDTDSMEQDLTDYESSNILSKMTNRTVDCIIGYMFILDKRYIVALFKNMVERMLKMHASNNLYINEHELKKLQHMELKRLLTGECGFFQHYNIDILTVKKIKQYQWLIQSDGYEQFKNMKPRQYIRSEQYECNIGDKYTEIIQFHLECCVRYTDESEKCGLFFYLDLLPSYIEAIRIEYYVMCENFKDRKYTHQMTPQWLSPHNFNGFKQYCGFQTFSAEQLDENVSLEWIIGLKITDKIYIEEVINEDMAKENIEVSINVEDTFNDSFNEELYSPVILSRDTSDTIMDPLTKITPSFYLHNSTRL